MKKAVNISIAQTLFAIEEDAYQKLDQYLKSIRDHFIHTEEQTEIVEDIEARISEQFLETKKRVITLKEVAAVIESMGRVEDFGDAEEETPALEVRKKLYRNPKDKIIAGVCSGLAAYVNIDPLWIRIAFVALTILTSGICILIYILLALVIPEAKTAAQALEMKGSPVTLETMSQNLKETVGDIRYKHGSTIKKVLSWPFQILKKIVDFLIRFLGPIIRIAVGIMLAVMALGAITFLSILAHTLLTKGEAWLDIPFSEIISMPVFFLTTISAYLILVIPLIVIFLLAISLFRKRNLVTFKVGMTFLFLWCVSLVTGSVGGFSTAADFERYLRTHQLFETVDQTIEISEDIKNLSVRKGVRLTLVQGPKAELTISGRKNQLDTINADQNIENTLLLERIYGNPFCFFCDYGDVQATLTLPDLTKLEAFEHAHVEIENWKSEKPIEIFITSSSFANLKIDAPKVTAQATNSAYALLDLNTPVANLKALESAMLEVAGVVTSTNIWAENSSSIQATRSKIDSVIAEAHESSNIELPALQSIKARAYENSRIVYEEVKIQDPDSLSSNGSFIGPKKAFEDFAEPAWEYDDTPDSSDEDMMPDDESEEAMDEQLFRDENGDPLDPQPASPVWIIEDTQP